MKRKPTPTQKYLLPFNVNEFATKSVCPHPALTRGKYSVWLYMDILKSRKKSIWSDNSFTQSAQRPTTTLLIRVMGTMRSKPYESIGLGRKLKTPNSLKGVVSVLCIIVATFFRQTSV
jgi:hypothetical protein